MSNYYPTLEKHSTSQRDQGPNGIVAGAAAGVADDVGIAFCQTRELRRVKTGVHTSQHGKMPGGW